METWMVRCFVFTRFWVRIPLTPASQVHFLRSPICVLGSVRRPLVHKCIFCVHWVLFRQAMFSAHLVVGLQVDVVCPPGSGFGTVVHKFMFCVYLVVGSHVDVLCSPGCVFTCGCFVFTSLWVRIRAATPDSQVQIFCLQRSPQESEPTTF